MFVGFVGDFSVSAAPKGSVEVPSGVLCPRRLGCVCAEARGQIARQESALSATGPERMN